MQQFLLQLIQLAYQECQYEIVVQEAAGIDSQGDLQLIN